MATISGYYQLIGEIMDHQKFRDLYERISACDEEAVGKLFEMANGDDPDALLMLGMLYDPALPTTFKNDAVLAFTYYERAAILGSMRGQYFLASMYNEGTDIEQNLELARQWFFKAATSGDSEAQMHYARMLQVGRGGIQNIEEAGEWYGKAAEQGHELAMTNLARMHLDGELKGSHEGIAWNLFEHAAEKLDGVAHYYLGIMYGNGRFVPRDAKISLFHICIAVILLPEGDNRNEAAKIKEQYLIDNPDQREQFERGALSYLRDKNYVVPS